VKDFVTINKSIAYMFSILLFSLSGIPPLLGFWGKFFILMLVNKYYSFELVLGLLMLSILSMFYYIRFIKIIFFEKTLIYNSFSIITYNKSCFGLFLLFINIFGFYFLDFFLTLSYKIVIYLYI
jgi:NADH:ubiquinone oxidoreductase subunit 2 (subunit N)